MQHFYSSNILPNIHYFLVVVFCFFSITLSGQNIISNSGFELGNAWTSYVNTNGGYSASVGLNNTTKHSGNYAMKLQITQIANNPGYQISLKNNSLDIMSGRSYQASIWMKASSANMTAQLHFRKNSTPYTSYSNETIQLSTSWEMYNIVWENSTISTSSDVRLAIEFGTAIGTIYIDDAVVTDCSRQIGLECLQTSIIGKGRIKMQSSIGEQECLSAGNSNFSNGANISLNATPEPGYTFTGWGGSCSGNSNCTLTMDEAKYVSAFFTKTSNADVCIDYKNKVDWSIAGYNGIIPYVNENIIDMTQPPYNCVGNNSTNNYSKIQAALNDAHSSNGWSVLYFPAGTYKVSGNSPLIIRDSVIIRGDCPSSTKLNLNFAGYNGKKGCLFFQPTGGNGGNKDILNGAYLNSRQITLSSTTGISEGDFIEITQDNDASLMYDAPGWPGQTTAEVTASGNGWGARAVGEIALVIAKNGNTLWLDRGLHHTYRQDLNPKAKRISMVKNSGIENLKLEKLDSDSSYNVYMDYAYNCWYRNVYSHYTVKGHISIQHAYHCEIRDSYFYNSHRFGSTGMAYGADMKFHCTSNLVENNIFRKLRHAMIVSIGCNGNVYGYNYSRESQDQLGAGVNTKCDISLHGFYPFMNLYEGNIVQYIYSGDWNGSSGPGNTFFRNRVYDKPLKIKNSSKKQNVVGNELTNWALGGPGINSNIEIQSSCTGTNQHSNNDRGSIDQNLFSSLPSSLYKNSPNNLFGYQIPSIGPFFPIESHNNLAYENYMNGSYVDCLQDCPINMDSVFTSCNNNISINAPTFNDKRTLHGIKITGIPNNYGGFTEGNPELYYKIKVSGNTIFTSTEAPSGTPPQYLECNYINITPNTTYSVEIWDDDSPISADDHLATISFQGGTSNTTHSAQGASIQLTRTDYTTNYAWSTGSNSNPETITQPGSYDLIIETPQGCSAEHTFNVSLNNPVQIITQPWGPQTLCPNSPPGILGVSAQGGFSLDYQWYVNSANSNSGGSMINGANSSNFVPPTNTYGTKYYYCIVSDNSNTSCGSDTSITSAVTIQNAPLITSHPSTHQIICQNTPVSLLQVIATGPSVLNYQWHQAHTPNSTYPNTSLTGETSSTFIPPNDSIGVFYYYCTAISKGTGTCLSASTNICTVEVVSQASIISQSIDSQNICLGEIPSLINLMLSDSGNHISYQWHTNNSHSNIGGNPIAGAHNANYLPSPNVGTNYYYCDIVINGGGCQNLSSQAFVVTANTGSNIVGENNLHQAICPRDTIGPLSITANIGDYQWYSNNSASYFGAQIMNGQINDSLLLSSSQNQSPGSYYYYCISADTSIMNCGSDTSTIFELIIIDSTYANFNFSDSITQYTFNNTSTNSNNYLWYFGDGDSSLLTNPIHSYDSVGQYIVSLITSNSCGSDTLSDTIHINITSNTGFEKNHIEIYPNPIVKNDQLNVIIPINTIGRLSVYNSLGQSVFSAVLNKRKNIINTSKWSKASYILKWENEDNIYHKQLVVQ